MAHNVFWRNQQGFVLVTAATLLPVLLSFFIFIGFTMRFLRARNFSKHGCNLELMKYQTKQGRLYERTLDLNPRAQNLRIQRSLAEKALVVAEMSGHPATIAAAKANLLRVKGLQTIFAAQQKAYITAIKMHNESAQREVPIKLGRTHELRYGWHESSSPKWHLEPESSPSPDFILATNFANLQTVSLKWIVTVSGFDIVREHLLPSELQYKDSCGATLWPEDPYNLKPLWIKGRFL